ncbi:MAG TPA: Glu/Leu/Phe/Val dehydrogenase dimerization domain-containing protein [Candidatus Ozemobacteraceae bacterium]|nr:Glu/Leu/Phe/Val dehydrogenase dimerization domain-containing protein [Candidatus Ozemobacteraceae bacterium]
MNLLDRMSEHDYEQVLFALDDPSGLKAIIAIHDTTLGPAMGGVRFKAYATEEEALKDVLQLSRAMTLKASAAGLNLGGGQAVILADSAAGKSEALLRAFGRQIQALSGRLFVAEDLGTTVEDMETIQQETEYVAGLRKSRGGSGEPSLKAAYGVIRGIGACLLHVHGDPGLRGRVLAIQGVGAVGREIARQASEEGARVIVADKDPRRIDDLKKHFEVQVVSPDHILETECDVFCPCALGGVLSETTVPRLRAKIVAGAANNQLVDENAGKLLFERGIIYAPDFVISAGGLINVAEELTGYDENLATLRVGKLYQRIEAILKVSEERKIPTHLAAAQMALERLELMRKVRRTYVPNASSLDR